MSERMASPEAVPKGWMKGGSSPVRGALLGLVLEQPGAGGELTVRLQERFGETWKVGRRDVYRLLEGLEREGLLQCVEQHGAGREHASQLIFHPTKLTSPALSEWMGSSCAREPARQGIEAKLLVSTEKDAPALCRSLIHYEMECLTLVQSLPPASAVSGAAPDGPDSAAPDRPDPRSVAEGPDSGSVPDRPDPGSVVDLLRDCARDGMLSYLQAEIDWARATRTRIEEFRAAGGG